MKQLYRCRWNRKLFGVFGGLGIYFNIDPTLLRVLFIILTIPLGLFLLPIAYVIAALLIPEGPKHYIQPHCKHLYRSLTNKKVAGVCGGLGEFFGIDPNILRIITVILMIVTVFLPIAFIYVICALIIPVKPHHQ